MVAFRKYNGHMIIAEDIYEPCFAIEMVLVKSIHIQDLLETIQSRDWDRLFLLMMYECPSQVIVDCDLRERALEEFAGREAYEVWALEHAC